MRMCPDMCGLCTLACEDHEEDCPGWASAKEGQGCEDAKDFMLPKCPHSCGICAKIPVLAPKEKTEL